MKKLAINNGPKHIDTPFPIWPFHGEEEKRQLLEVLESNQWGTLGPKSLEFEKAFAEYLNVSRVQTVSNGTVSLDTILRALGIGRGDEVIVPPYTFIATVTAVLMVNATPVFADIDPETNCIDPQAIEAVITGKTKAIIPVHMAGIPADMDRICAIGKKYGISIIEDAAQAHGSEWNGRKVGSIGTAGSFSFQLSKNMSAGEGGAISTNDPALADKIWSIHHIGRKKDSAWYEHFNLSSNYRITDWQAGILLAQLARLDEQIDQREISAKILDNIFSDIPGINPFLRDLRATRITWHLYMFRYDKNEFNGLPKDRFVEALEAEGIPASTGYRPLQKQPLFKEESIQWILGDKEYHNLLLPGLNKACEQTVWLTQNVLLSEKSQLKKIGEAIIKIKENVDELL